MNQFHRPHGRRPEDGILRRVLILAALLLLLLAAILILGTAFEPEVTETSGDIEARFRPATTYEHDGITYTHQDYDYVTLLLIGIDQPTLTSTSYRARAQADFLLLISIDRSSREVHMLHIDRDTITPVQVYGALGNPAGTRPLQICLSYAFLRDPDAAARNTVQAVSELLHGITIDHYIVMDTGGMTALNDALGGVTVTLTDDLTALDPSMTAGATITLHGEQAEYYLRGRMNVGAGTNASRMARQATFMQAALAQFNASLAEDLVYANSVLAQLDPHLLMDCQSDWLLDQLYSIRDYTQYAPVSLEGTHVLGESGFVEFYPDSDALNTYVLNHFFK